MIKHRKIALLLGALVLLAASCRSGSLDVPEPTAGSKGKTFSTTIYVPQEDGTLDAKDVELKDTEDRPSAAVTELFRKEKKYFPNGVKVLGVKVDSKGHAVVNLSRKILDKTVANEESERLGLGAIVRTLAEFKDVKQVSINVEGRSTGELDGKQIDNWWGFGSLKLQPFAIKK